MRVLQEINVRNCDTYDNIFGIQKDFTNYLMERNCWYGKVLVIISSLNIFQTKLLPERFHQNFQAVLDAVSMYVFMFFLSTADHFQMNCLLEISNTRNLPLESST